MAKQIFLKSLLLSAVSLSAFSAGCAVAAKTADEKTDVKTAIVEKDAPAAEPNAVKTFLSKKGITFTASSPAETIRLFYQNLREKKFREAIMMTNLKASVENLSDAETQDLSPDFAALATQIPAELEISGEIITGEKAVVTVKLPNEDTGAIEDKVFNLQHQNDQWIYLMADPATEAAAKREGKNYFFALRLEVHHNEAQSMIRRIAKAEMVYALQNANAYAEMPVLVSQGLLPGDAEDSDSTGYHYNLTVSPDKKNYTVNAEPAAYGKTGKLSFLLQVDENGKTSGIESKDKKGMPLKN